MHLFLDAAKLNKDLHNYICGYTFNHKILKTEYLDLEINNKTILNIIENIINENKLVSVQFPLVYKLKNDLELAYIYSQVDKVNVIIKCPFTSYGLKLANELSKKNIKVNLTLTVHPKQLYLYHCLPYKYEYLSLFYHSLQFLIDDNIYKLIDHLLKKHNQKIIWGQIRTSQEFLKIIYRYTLKEEDIHKNLYCTVKPKLLESCLKEALSDSEIMLKDWDDYAIRESECIYK